MILLAGVHARRSPDGGGRRGGARRGRRGGADTGWCQGRAPPQAGHSCLGPQHRQGTGVGGGGRGLLGGGGGGGRTPMGGGSRGGAVTRYNRTVRGSPRGGPLGP